MDVNLLRAVLTTLSFLAFLLIVFWAFGPRSKHRFDAAANLPFDDHEINRRSALGAATGGQAQKTEHHTNG